MDPQTAACLTVISTVVSAAAAVVVGFFSYFTMKVAQSNLSIAKRIEWLTGALESHSTIQLRLDAKKYGSEVEMIWWDPTIAPVPSIPKHGEKAELSKIYLFLPESLRAGKEKLEYSLG